MTPAERKLVELLARIAYRRMRKRRRDADSKNPRTPEGKA